MPRIGHVAIATNCNLLGELLHSLMSRFVVYTLPSKKFSKKAYWQPVKTLMESNVYPVFVEVCGTKTCTVPLLANNFMVCRHA